MMNPIKSQVNDVGVIIGRFQVDELTEGHVELFDSVVDKHQKIIVFLGLSPLKCTEENPLDYEARKQMILERYPKVNVLYIKDTRDNIEWSKNLDDMIKDITGPSQTVMLYGSRDSFIKHYYGNFECTELEQTKFTTGTTRRKLVSIRVKASMLFRAGVIWAIYNMFKNAIPTVDTAILSDDKKKILLGKKAKEKKYRFIGGHVNPKEDYESAAIRETLEETNLNVHNLKYITSIAIDDWRHRKEKSGITTILYTCEIDSGKPVPGDDIDELMWFPIQEFIQNDNWNLVEEHRPLMVKLLEQFNPKLKR